MSSRRWFVAVAACAAQAVLGTACTDVGVVPEDPEEGGAGTVALDGPQASWAGGLFPDPENDPRCEPVGSKGGVEEYRCETRTTPLTRNDDDIWFICRYRVEIYSNGGQIVITVQLLRCWIYRGEGGEQEASLTLDCGSSPTRGTSGGCVASIEGDDVDSDAVRVEWESRIALASGTKTTTWAGTGENYWSWQGVATASAEITVTVITGEEVKDTMSDNATVSVLSRLASDWSYPGNNASIIYRVHPDSTLWGQHHYDLDILSIEAGAGPWDDTFIAAHLPTMSTEMWLHSDFVSTGPQYPVQDTIACAGLLPGDSSNLYQINGACGSADSLSTFHDSTEVHERAHESSLNQCLRSGSAPQDLQELEALVVDELNQQEIRDRWDAFDVKIGDANEGMVSGFYSPLIWDYRGYGRWARGVQWQIAGHAGTSGC